MKKYLVILFMVFIISHILSAQPHPVMIEVVNADGNIPDPGGLTFQAWRVNDPEYLLTENSTDCYFPAFGIYLHINCGSFVTWNPGDTLHVVVFDDFTEEWADADYVLNADNIQTFNIGNGGMILGVQLALPEQLGFRYYDGLTIDLQQYITWLWDDNYIITVSEQEHFQIEIDSLLVNFSADGSWFGTEQIFITVDDNSRSITTDSLLVEVYPNHAPEFSFPAEGLSFNEDEELTINLLNYTQDFEDDELFFEVMGNSNLIIDLNDSQLHLAAPENWFGIDSLLVTAEDGQNRILTVTSLVVNVIAVNDPPQLSIPATLTADEDNNISLNIVEVIFDIENDSLLITCEGSEHITFQADDEEMNFIPQPDWSGNEELVIDVSDGEITVTDTISILIYPVNDPPVMELPAYHTFAADLEMILDLSPYISDVDNTDLTITASAGNLQIDFTGLVAEFTALAGWHGSEDVVFTVSDNTGRLTAVDTMQVNAFLLEDTVIDISDVLVDDGEYLEIDLNATTIFEHWSISNYQINLSYDPYYIQYFGYTLDNTLCAGGNVSLTVDENNNDALITVNYSHYLPVNGEGSIIKIWFHATCYGETEISGYDCMLNNQPLENIIPGLITINDIGNTNHPPRADAGADYAIGAGEEGELDGTLSWDPDGGTLTYLWQTPPEIIIEDPTLNFVTFTAPNVIEDTQFTVSLTVVDQDLNANTDTCEITVIHQNYAPQIDLPESWQFPEDTIFNENVNQYIFDPNGDELTLTCSGNINLDVTIEETTVTLTPAADWSGSELLIFTVSDNRMRLLGVDSLLVEVTPVNDAPLAEAGADISIRDGETGYLDGSLSIDPDNDELTFLWQADQFITIAEPEQAVTDFEVAQVEESETVVVYLTVDDQQVRLTSVDSLFITITDDEIRDLEAINLGEGEISLNWLQPFAFVTGIFYQVYIDNEFVTDVTETDVVVNTEEGIHLFGVCAVYEDGNSDLVEIELEVTANGINELPLVTELTAIYPNPFNPSTTISFALAQDAQVKIDIYDIRGRKVTELLNEFFDPGWYDLTWNASHQTSGVYFIRLKTENITQYKKVNLIK